MDARHYHSGEDHSTKREPPQGNGTPLDEYVPTGPGRKKVKKKTPTKKKSGSVKGRKHPKPKTPAKKKTVRKPAKKKAVRKKATRASKPGKVSSRKKPTAKPPVLSDFVDADIDKRNKTRVEDQRRWSEDYRRRITSSGRDIAPLPIEDIDWDLRLRCKDDLKLFETEYLPTVFFKGFSTDHDICIRKIEDVFRKSGDMFALAMPRGGGKTAHCRAGLIWGTAYAFRLFPFFVGSKEDKAVQTLEFIKTYWFRNVKLRRDFPEIGWSIFKLENRFHLARGQTFNGQSSHVEYGSDTLRYPSLLLPSNIAEVYEKHDPDSLLKKQGSTDNFTTTIADDDGNEETFWLAASAGIVIRTAGIDGSIRGEAEVHPITLAQPRPDVVLLDDIQKDAKAESPASVVKMMRLLDGAVQGLAGPGENIAALMPCTVIQNNDVSDQYLDRKIKPEWRGERCQLVNAWPEGITDSEIGMDTEAGILWNEYAEERKKSYTLYEDNRLGTAHYKKNRKKMDEGFVCSWDERFDKANELSAQQHAFNLRLKSPLTFAAEYQNRPAKAEDGSGFMITAKQLMEKNIAFKRSIVPTDAMHLVSFIDVQNEILFYATLAVASDFTGSIVDFGTFPEVGPTYFRKSQVDGWSLLTNLFFKAYPQHQDKALVTKGGKRRAPLEAKIYHALQKGCEYLRAKNYTKEGTKDKVGVQRIGIDFRWGQAADVIKRFCKECGMPEVVPCMGQAVPPSNRQFEEYTRTKGWMFEDSIHPQVKEVKWIYRPDAAGQYQMVTDVSRTKSWLMARLASPLGSPGSIAMFNAPQDELEMFADHVCNSEYPDPTTQRGITKDLWLPRAGNPDNDFLDCFVGCCSLAGLTGASLKTTKPTTTRTSSRKGKLSDKYNNKNNQRRRKD